jgi:hypothetical protein
MRARLDRGIVGDQFRQPAIDTPNAMNRRHGYGIRRAKGKRASHREGPDIQRNDAATPDGSLCEFVRASRCVVSRAIAKSLR